MDNLKKALIALTILGLLVSVYMTIYKYSGNEGMCLGSGDCGTVNASRYSQIEMAGVNVPVAVVGIGGYLVILAVLLYEKKNELLRQNGMIFLFGLTLMGFLFSMYLVYVEVAILKAYCPFCVTSQITMTLIFILTVIRLVRQPNQ